MLRLPHGQIALIAGGMFVMIVLAYWVGVMRGSRSGDLNTPLQSVVETEGIGSRSDPGINPGVVPGNNPGINPGINASVDPSRAVRNASVQPESGGQRGMIHPGQDPREPGLNYFVLAHYPKEDTRKLLDFIGSQGVPAAGLRRPGKDRYQVIALRGFYKDELDQPEYNQYKQQLLRLGRLWHSRKLGPNFAGIFPALYKGDEVAEIMISETQP